MENLEEKSMEMDEEKIYKTVSETVEYSKVITTSEDLEWLSEEELEPAVPEEEFKTIKEYLDSKMGSEEEAKAKKLMALSSVLSGDESSPQELAAAIDEGVTETKIDYKVGMGDLDPLEAIELKIDRTAARLNAFLQEKYNSEVVGEVVSNAIAVAYPPAIAAKPFIKTLIRLAEPVIRKTIEVGVKAMASIAKAATRKVFNKFKQFSKRIAFA